ncbi:SSU ribosomal protein S2p (SAe) [Mycoplasmopsis meleagridis]|uniref:Small ribosomal subunit protein uS2 n=1 Tax=Mycoplasmopsis meleagridis ATCC 25294 TaxID=1264554 RepID=A0A0F5H0Y6_9BACT|nr:30S ribosomal protein S2 [Mycoplasmopsis meleagridis]KKB26873.1 SSU ribosomal protein S2p (SAe) [Mycoplasmopsis meleagridis ATCC 25294]OAD18298.1 SSU ribosomal protein S2p (SAe) [Mycoplasmopsis meleagridis]VEU77529.1 Vegetative protein 209 [Mycoplasmopsis meleagridis]
MNEINKEEKVAKNDPTKVDNKVEGAKVDDKKGIVSRDKLLEAGTYFGHKTSQWNPKMKEFLLPNIQSKRGIHIIDTNSTIKRLEFIYKLLNKFATNPRTTFIFVGTKKQAKEAIKENALRTNSFYVSERWLGGTFTNFQTISKRIKTMEELEQMKEEGYPNRTKKEILDLEKKLSKLHANLDGIRKMQGPTNFMIIADPNDDEIAIKEARRKGVKVIGLLDSNTDPDLVDFGIPANDDSAKSINVIITILADAIATARGDKAKYAYQGDEAIILPKYENQQRENSFKKPFVKKETSEVKGE